MSVKNVGNARKQIAARSEILLPVRFRVVRYTATGAAANSIGSTALKIAAPGNAVSWASEAGRSVMLRHALYASG